MTTGLIGPPPNPPRGAIRTGRRGIQKGRFRKQRALFIAEMRLRGTPMAEITKALNLKVRQIQREMVYAIDSGWLEGVRLRLQETANRAPAILDAILDTDPEVLHKHHKGYALKSEVAREMMKGLGVLTPEQKRTTVNLHNWHANQAPPVETSDAPTPYDGTLYEYDSAEIHDPRPELAAPDGGDARGGDLDESGEGG